MNAPRRSQGFTLLETLVALAILAVALTAALHAVGGTARSAAALRDHTLADWVAHNRLAELRATGAWPEVGTQRGDSEQAGRSYQWEQQVKPTPNPLFRRVAIRVFDDSGERPLVSVTGFVVRPLR